MSAPINSLWGRPWDISPLAFGIWIVRTEEHCGYYLEPEQNRAVPEDWQVATVANLGLAGWYKSDRDWCLVALTFPCSFSRDERVKAKRTFEAWIAPKLVAAHDKTGRGQTARPHEASSAA
jgi:hypothetical protein